MPSGEIVAWKIHPLREPAAEYRVRKRGGKRTR
jgi:hypothetical protein